MFGFLFRRKRRLSKDGPEETQQQQDAYPTHTHPLLSSSAQTPAAEAGSSASLPWSSCSISDAAQSTSASKRAVAGAAAGETWTSSLSSSAGDLRGPVASRVKGKDPRSLFARLFGGKEESEVKPPRRRSRGGSCTSLSASVASNTVSEELQNSQDVPENQSELDVSQSFCDQLRPQPEFVKEKEKATCQESRKIQGSDKESPVDLFPAVLSGETGDFNKKLLTDIEKEENSGELSHGQELHAINVERSIIRDKPASGGSDTDSTDIFTVVVESPPVTNEKVFSPCDFPAPLEELEKKAAEEKDQIFVIPLSTDSNKKTENYSPLASGSSELCPSLQEQEVQEVFMLESPAESSGNNMGNKSEDRDTGSPNLSAIPPRAGVLKAPSPVRLPSGIKKSVTFGESDVIIHDCALEEHRSPSSSSSSNCSTDDDESDSEVEAAEDVENDSRVTEKSLRVKKKVTFLHPNQAGVAHGADERCSMDSLDDCIDDIPLDSGVDCNSEDSCTVTMSNSSSSADAGQQCDLQRKQRQLKDAERRAMVQLESIKSKLISKETELSLLQADVNMLAVDRDNKALEIAGLTSQLGMLKHENEMSIRRIQAFESQLEDLRNKNAALSDELFKKTEQLKCAQFDTLCRSDVNLDENLTLKIQDLEAKIKMLEEDRKKLMSDREFLEKDRSNQVKVLQDALDEALEAKAQLKAKYEKELRELQESNSTLVDDFEWKLHQVEATCKKKLLQKDQEIDEKIKQAQEGAVKDLHAERQKLEEERKELEQKLRQVEHLKAYEAEVTQLRGVTSEQQKSLKAASRALEQFKLNERVMQTEIGSLKSQLEEEKRNCRTLTNSTRRRLDACEQSAQEKLEKEKLLVNREWEKKMRSECERLKEEWRKLADEEKSLALESQKSRSESDMEKAKQNWEKARQELVREIGKLKEEMRSNESQYQKELSRMTTSIDREKWELRRKMDKMTDSHLEEIDALKESHSEEIDHLRCRYENAVDQIKQLQKRLEEFEKTNRSTDSVATGKDSGIMADPSCLSVTDKNFTANDQDSDCSSEEEEEEEEEEEDEEEEESECDEEEEESEEEEFESPRGGSSMETGGGRSSIAELRDEVATLQGSIETLTLNLKGNLKGAVKGELSDQQQGLEGMATPTLVSDSSSLKSASASSSGSSSLLTCTSDTEAEESE